MAKAKPDSTSYQGGARGQCH